MQALPSGASRLGRWFQRAVLLSLTMGLAACGGEGASQSAAGQTKLLATSATSATSASPAAVTQNVTVTGLAKVNETRVNRTEFDYGFHITATNIGSFRQTGVTATLLSAGPGTTIVNGTVQLGDLEPGATVTPPGIITIRQDRTQPFDQSALEWQISGTPVGNNALALIDAGGATMAVPGYAVQFPTGSLTMPTPVQVTVSADPDLTSRYADGAWLFGPDAVQASEELRVTMAANNLAQSAQVALTLAVPESLAAKVSGTTRLALLSLQTYSSDDDEAGETIDSAVAMTSTYDPVARTLSASVPASSFIRVPDGSAEAVFKIFLISTAQAAAAQASLSGPQSKAAAPVCATPVPKESTDGAVPYHNPLGETQLKIVAPYADLGSPHFGVHNGLDLRADAVPVLAARNGYIELIRVQSCDGTKKKAVICKNDLGNKAFYVVVRHPDNSATRYFHLKNFSALWNKNPIGGADNATIQQYWRETKKSCPSYPVSAGEQIATSGKTGAAAPHLHFEAGTSLDPGGFPDTFNPILRLGQAKAEALPLPSVPANPLLLAVAPATMKTVNLSLFDHTSGSEILVRRQGSSGCGSKKEVLLPVTAKHSDLESCSNTDVTDIAWAVDDALTIKQFPNYKADVPLVGGATTDNGGVQLTTPAGFSKPLSAVATIRAHVSTGDTPQTVTATLTPQGLPGGFWIGSATIQSCSEFSKYRTGCNYLSDHA